MVFDDLQRDLDIDKEALDALVDLERNKPDDVKRGRTSQRVQIRAKVIAQPGNSGDRHKFQVQGVTGDVSSGGCQVLFPLPLRVGDIYWLAFDAEKLKLGSVLARCLRCRLIREDAFEAGFKFFEPIDVSEAVQCDKTETLFA